MNHVMELRRCETCGGELVQREDFWQCKFCGNKFFSKEEKGKTLIYALNYAAELRRRSDFDGAIVEYATILKSHPEDDEANWGIFIARCGIEYVKDDRTGNMIPTCHRTLTGDVLQDEYYRKAIANASEQQAAIYESQCKIISRLQKKIKHQMEDEEDYEVFISFKAKDQNGCSTKDSVVARSIYDKLSDKGIKTFFSEVTLADRVGEEFEPIIYKALYSCQYFILVTTSEDHTNAVWVKNEWARFRDRMYDENMTQCAFAVFEGKNCVPGFLHGMQGFDLSKYPNGGYEIAVADFLLLKLGKVRYAEPAMQYTLPPAPSVHKKKKAVPLLVATIAILLAATIGLGAWMTSNSIGSELFDRNQETTIQAEHSDSTFSTTVSESDGEDITNSQKIETTSKVTETEKQPMVYTPTEGLSYILINNGKAYQVSGIGTAMDTEIVIPSTYKDLPVLSIGKGAFGNSGSLTSVVISEGVTSIGDGAFARCYKLQKIILPEGIQSIGEEAFSNCSSLSDITIPNGVTRIGEKAFYKCGKLESIEMPDSITSIGNNAFDSCYYLTNIMLPKGLTSIGDHAFYYCFALTSLTLPKGVTNIGDAAFKSCTKLSMIQVESGNTAYHVSGNCLIETESKTLILGFDDSVIPTDKSVTSIAADAFSSAQYLNNITIPSSVKSIGENAFANCNNITKITIEDGVTSIGNKAFYRCSKVTEVTFPGSLQSIGSMAYSGCTGLTSIIFQGTKEQWKNITKGNDWYENTGNFAIHCTDGDTGKQEDEELAYTLINGGTAYEVSGIGSVSTPNVEIPATYDGLPVVSIGKNAFKSYTAGVSITMPDSIISIGASAFYGCSKLADITISNSITSIGENAFYGCSKLTNITFPGCLTSVGGYALRNCTALTEITFSGTKTQWSDVQKSNRWNENTGEYTIRCTDGDVDKHDGEEFAYTLIDQQNGYKIIGIGTVTSADIIIPSTYHGLPVTSIGDMAFCNSKQIINVTIPDSIISIGDAAFSNCDSLKKIVIPYSVTDIGNSAFNDCESLCNVVLSEGLKSIGNSAFGYCEDLTIITIPKGVMSIGDDAFCFCTKLSSLTVPNSVASIGVDAFLGCTALKNIEVETGNTAYRFVENSLIETATGILRFCTPNGTIPSDGSVISIDRGAFRTYNTITSLNIPASVISIGKNTFYDCANLVSIVVAPGNKTYHSVGNCLIETASKTLIVGSNNSEIPSDGSVQIIGEMAFNRRNLTSITVPNGVTTIGNSAFAYSGLTSITLPNTLEVIEDSAFSGCSTLTKIVFEGTKAQWNAIKKNGPWNSATGNYTIYCTDGNIAK